MYGTIVVVSNKEPDNFTKTTRSIFLSFCYYSFYYIHFISLFFFIFLNLKAPITTAADDKFCDIFLNFRQN